jgi:hypothetical protein
MNLTLIPAYHPTPPKFIIIWAKFYEAGSPKSWNRISKTERIVVTTLERKGSKGMLCRERRVQL